MLYVHKLSDISIFEIRTEPDTEDSLPAGECVGIAFTAENARLFASASTMLDVLRTALDEYIKPYGALGDEDLWGLVDWAIGTATGY